MSELDDLRAEVKWLREINAELLATLDEVAVAVTKTWLNHVRAVVAKAKEGP